MVYEFNGAGTEKSDKTLSHYRGSGHVGMAVLIKDK
jgi:hypothetical protein